ncbi:response regulator [Flavobacterium sp.]|jgi:CheY-like chemotaxis protein|uniref:response regulator n=1 Tax=Flavobacterium sp. TaxID=239 RepID=UPI0037BE409E
MKNNIKSVVLIDDDLAINYFHKSLFLKLELGGNVFTFSNSNAALEGMIKLEDTHSESDMVYVFLDINMPDVDGWAFLEKFKKINELIKFEVKIFILSSSINPEDVEKAKNNNFVTNYFAKPLMMDGIIAIKEMYS